MSKLATEPVAVGAVIGAVIPAAFGFAAAFNAWHPSDAQYTAAGVLYAAILAVVTAVSRSKVTPTE